MSLARELRQALYDAFGPIITTPMVPSQSVTADGSGEGTISDTGAMLYGLSYTITASNNTLDVRFLNSTATGGGVGSSQVIVLNIKALVAGTDSLRYDVPLRFDKGLRWLTSASGTTSPQFYLHWAPLSLLNIR